MAVILRDQAGHLLHQMNYIVAWSNVPEWSPNHSTGDVDQMSGSANDYLSLDNRVSLETRVISQRVTSRPAGLEAKRKLE